MKLLKEICTDVLSVLLVLTMIVVCVAFCTRAGKASTGDSTARSWLQERRDNLWDVKPDPPETWTPPSFREPKSPPWRQMEVPRPNPFEEWRRPNINRCYMFFDCNESD